MEKLGLLAGMSWQSTAVYYKRMNEIVQQQLGGFHSAELIMHSFDFAKLETCLAKGDWDTITGVLVREAKALELAGAKAIVICTNTMHKVADSVQEAVSIPLLHIADVTAAALKKQGLKKTLLLATGYTMEQDFYKGRLREMHGQSIVVPNAAGRKIVHDIIFDELVQGDVLPVSKQQYLDIIKTHIQQDGIDSVILGCTEIGMLITQDDLDIAVLDTAELHCQAAIEFSLT